MHGPVPGRASNEEITELALDSAIALDKRLRQEPIDSNIVDAFLHVLEGIVNVSADHAAGRLISDPRKMGVVTRAYRHLQQENLSTIQELIEKINQMSQTYRDPNVSAAQIELLRDFCIALHREFLGHALRSYDAERRRDAGKQNAARLL